MTLIQINENKIAKARCDEMPVGDYFIFSYIGENVTFKYWNNEEFKLDSDMVFIDNNYMTSDTWEEVVLY